MFERFESPKLLLARARRHIQEFDASRAIFVKAKPHKSFTEIDTKTGDKIWKVILNPVPKDLPIIAFDAINCLRSALDHTVFDASIVIGGKPKPKSTKFPFGETADIAKGDLKRHRAEVPIALHSFLLGFEPYKGGTNKIWELNEIRNGKIHQTLRPINATLGGMHLGNGYIGEMSYTMVSEWDGSKNELSFMRVKSASNVNMQFNLTFDIAFDQTTWFGRKSALDVLRDFAEIVDRIILGIEAESSRIIRPRKA